jgi:putative inorganic carbon (HCO3(-)) transporter
MAMSTRERLTFGHGVLSSVMRRPAVAAAALAREPLPVRFSRLETWDWGWGGLLIFSILLFFRPQDQIAALGALHISDAAAVIGLVAMVMLNVSRGKAIIRLTPELAGVLALGAFILIGVPFSFWAGGSLQVFTSYYVQVALIFLLMVNTVTSPRRVERICWVIVLAFGYVAARTIFDYMRGINLVEGHRASGPVGGFFANPNDLALNLVAFLPLAMMYVQRPGPVVKRIVSLGITLLMLTAIVLTKSRSGQLGAAAMLLTYLIFTRSLRPGTLIGLVLAGLIVVPSLPASYWERMSSIVNEEQDATKSSQERRMLMEQAWQIFLDNPIFGIGAGQFQNYTDPGRAAKWRVTHNALLQVAAELGVFALITFSFLIVRAFGAAWWTRKTLSWIYLRGRLKGAAADEDGLDADERRFLQTTGAALIAALAGWFVCAMFASVAFNWTFYYLLGLAVTSRDIVRARARAYAQARQLAREAGPRVVAA